MGAPSAPHDRKPARTPRNVQRQRAQTRLVLRERLVRPLLTLVPERWSASWADNRAGGNGRRRRIDFLLPIARWKGYGRGLNSQGTTFETLTWGTALGLDEAHHGLRDRSPPLVNPVAAAKALVTADHAGGGRAGLNIVVGWNEDEFGMFGVRSASRRSLRLRAGMDRRGQAHLVHSRTRSTSTAPTSQMKGVEGNPKWSVGARPVMMNAGRRLSVAPTRIENCDALFTDAEHTSFEEVAAKSATVKDARARRGARSTCSRTGS